MRTRTSLRSRSLAACSVFALTAACSTSPHGRPPEVAAAWERLLTEAEAGFRAGRAGAATDLARQALAAAESSLPAEDVRLARPLLFLCSLLLVQRASGDAELLARRARGLAEREVDAARARLATTLKYLGAIYSEDGRLELADEALQSAYDLSVAADGADSTESAKHLANLGALRLRRGDRAGAEELLARALDTWSRAPAPHPVYTAGLLCNLAELRLQQARPEEALDHLRRAVAMQEQAFAVDDPRLHATVQRLAMALRICGKEKEALALVTRFGPAPSH